MSVDSSVPPRRSSAVALLVAGAFFMENLDGTVIATALPSMARSFSSTASALAVGMTAYLLTLAVFIPASGWMVDRFGARRVFSSAIALFTLASILCGFSHTLPQFTLARILQGGAGALMVPVGRLVVLRGTAKSDLIRAIATLTWPGLVAPVLGPPLGGFITAALSWRWIFFINVPLGLLGCLLAVRLVRTEQMDERRPFDSRGFLLNGLALALLLFAVDQFGQARADGKTASAALAASLVLGGLAIRHALRHPHPLVSLAAFRIPSFALTMSGGSLSRVAISTTPFLLPQLFQLGLGLGPGIAGLYVLWYGVANIGIKPVTSAILRRFGFRTVLVVNTVLGAAAIGLCALIGTTTPVPLTVLLLMLAGASRSMQFTALNTLAFADVPPGATNGANTLSNVASQLSVGLGIATGAITLRILDAALDAPGGPPERPFHAAFIVVAALALAPLAFYRRLAPEAGATVSGHRP